MPWGSSKRTHDFPGQGFDFSGICDILGKEGTPVQKPRKRLVISALVTTAILSCGVPTSAPIIDFSAGGEYTFETGW
jgi:hypothetical protein